MAAAAMTKAQRSARAKESVRRFREGSEREGESESQGGKVIVIYLILAGYAWDDLTGRSYSNEPTPITNGVIVHPHGRMIGRTQCLAYGEVNMSTPDASLALFPNPRKSLPPLRTSCRTERNCVEESPSSSDSVSSVIGLQKTIFRHSDLSSPVAPSSDSDIRTANICPAYLRSASVASFSSSGLSRRSIVRRLISASSLARSRLASAVACSACAALVKTTPKSLSAISFNRALHLRALMSTTNSIRSPTAIRLPPDHEMLTSHEPEVRKSGIVSIITPARTASIPTYIHVSSATSHASRMDFSPLFALIIFRSRSVVYRKWYGWVGMVFLGSVTATMIALSLHFR